MTANSKNSGDYIQNSLERIAKNGIKNKEDIQFTNQLLEMFHILLEIKALKKDGTQKQ